MKPKIKNFLKTIGWTIFAIVVSAWIVFCVIMSARSIRKDIDSATKVIKENRLKGIVEEIWYGDNNTNK